MSKITKKKDGYIITSSIRVYENIWNEFKSFTSGEGLNMSKVLNDLIKKYLKEVKE